MATRAQVAAQARGWIGTKFAHQHRARGVGVDCVGLVIGVARELGLVPEGFDVTGYATTPDGVALPTQCAAVMQPIQRAEMGEGDVVLVAWNGGPPQHLGIVCTYRHGGLAMVHADNRAHRCVVETRLLFGRSMCFMGAYRLPGVAA